MVRKKKSMQVDEGFAKEILKIKALLEANGKKTNSAELTRRIISSPQFKDIESNLLNNLEKMEFKISFDGRRK